MTGLWWFVVVVSVPVLVHLHRKNRKATAQRSAEGRRRARNSAHCKEIRRQKLARNGNYCEHCGRERDSTELQLHHLNDGAYWHENHHNTMILCATCHLVGVHGSR